MRHARIIGTGGHVPPKVVTNDDLVRIHGIDTDDAWIRQRTGVEERRFAAEGVGTAELGAHAAREALSAAGLDARDVDLVVFCTLSPDKAFPGSGVYMQRLLDIPSDELGVFTPCLDVRNQCSGFLYGLSHALAVVRAGMYERVLLVGAEVHSAGLDLSTRGRTVASLFGDGAGAVVIQASDEPGGIRRVLLGADGRHADALCQDVWDMSRRPFIALDAQGNGVIPAEHLWARMEGRRVFKHAVERMVQVLRQVCAAEEIELGEIDLFLLHQANLRISRAVQHQLDIPDDRILNNIHRFGNTTAATIPLLLDEAVRTGRLKPGMRVATAAFGSGFTWGAALIDW